VFFETSGHAECIEEFGVTDPVQRAQNIDKLYAQVRRIAPSRTTAEWETLLLKLDIPYAEFTKLDAVKDQEHLKYVALFQTLEHPTEGDIVQARPTTRFSKSPAAIHRLTPRLGENSKELLIEAGFDTRQIDKWLEKGVLRQAPP
jgi:formyl-CoA transferase